MQQAINYANFQIFCKPVGSVPRAGRRGSRFTEYYINGYRVYIHSKDFDRAFKGYLKTKGQTGADKAEPNPDPLIPEYQLYGFTWEILEFPKKNGSRRFLVGAKDTMDKVAKLFIP